jgi:hypothetical protein
MHRSVSATVNGILTHLLDPDLDPKSRKEIPCLSSVINSLRIFKGLNDLAFSGYQFYVEQRAEFLERVRHCIEQAK